MKRIRKVSKPSKTPIHGSAFFPSWRRRRYLIGGLLTTIFIMSLFAWRGLLPRKALTHDTDNIEMLRSLSLRLIGNEKFLEAESVLTQWCVLCPMATEPFKLRMDLRHNRALQLRPGDEQEKQKLLALEDGRRAITSDPNDVSTGTNVLLLCLAVGRFDEADVVARRFLKSNPENQELLFLQARISHALGSSLDAQNILDKLLSQRPEFTPGLMLRAILHYEANEAEKAIPLLRSVIAQGGGSHREARYHLGLALARAGQTEESSRILAEVQRDNFEKDTFAMDSLAVRVRKAELLTNCGKAKEAIELLRAVLSVDPQNAAAHRLMATNTSLKNVKKQTTASVVHFSNTTHPRDTRVVLDTPSKGGPWFEDITPASGIGFQHFDPATPELNILETMGSGLGWIDYDNDGLLDLLCIQVGPLPSSPDVDRLPTSKLFRNNGNRTFTDVSEVVGLAKTGFGMGCAVGDCDNDGYDDLVVTYWNGICIYHNEPDGHNGRRFVDVTTMAGLNNPHWATSCGWGDIDNDGDLDLYVCNYAEVDLAKYPRCEHTATKLLFSCPPFSFESVAHKLFRNDGDLTFTDITESSGIADASPAPGLGVVLTDLDRDGLIDIYVANDMRPAYLFHNQGGGRFIEKALLSGCGLGSSGENIAGMGVDAADVDDNGLPSLFVTNFHFKQNVLYRNTGGLLFDYWTHRSGLGTPSIGRLGFGAVFCDTNLDGMIDLTVANGHVERESAKIYGAEYAQQAQLFLGVGAGRFRDGSATSGPYFQEMRVGRGLCCADFDNDGKPDLAFSHNGGPIALLHNRTETSNSWLSLELVGDGKKSNRNAVGARVQIETSNRIQTRFVNGGGSYLSASDRRLLVGLGSAKNAERVTVRWPSGNEDTFLQIEGNRRWRLREGESLPEAIDPVSSSTKK